MKRIEGIIEKFFLLASLVSFSIVLLVFGFMVTLGLPLFKGGRFFDLFTQTFQPDHGLYGIYPMILGTLFIAGLGVLFAFPLSLGCSAFISVTGPGRLSSPLKKVVRLMIGIPTVIYGFVGIFFLVPIIRELFEKGSGLCILSAGILLALMISPTMILFFTDSFDRTHQAYLDAADALGATPVQKLLYIILPQSTQGIASGLILSMGRAVGDTLISLMVAGNAVAIPGSLLDPARTLTAHIALVIAADF